MTQLELILPGLTSYYSALLENDEMPFDAGPEPSRPEPLSREVIGIMVDKMTLHLQNKAGVPISMAEYTRVWNFTCTVLHVPQYID